MTAPRDTFGRPIVVVTGMGIVTSLGAGKADNWKKLTAGESGIRTVTRFPIDGLKSTMAGTVDFVTVEPSSSTGLTERLADIAAEEALAQSGIGRKGGFSGTAVPRGRAGRGRMAAADRSRTRGRQAGLHRRRGACDQRRRTIRRIPSPFHVRLGGRTSGRGDPKGGVSALLGALFGLWGFMLAFTFSQSGTRFETVRSMIVDEGNILRNTIIRADFFPDSVRNSYRADLRKYLEERIAYYDYDNDAAKFRKNREEISKTATALWKRTVEQSKKPELTGPANNMATSLTNLFDIGIKREALLSAGIPMPVNIMLVVLALSISLVGGFTTPTIKRKEWIVVFVFAFLASTILYITIDLARPMEGLIKPDAGQQIIINLRKLF